MIRVWKRLESAGLRPILIKGWSTARLYPDPDKRSLGDIDLCFTPSELPKALALRRAFPRDFLETDYHEGFPDLPDRTWDELFARSQLIAVAGTAIRVLASEEHLRLTCRHLMRHGGITERMLQDVAAIVNAVPDGFDWNECLRGDEHVSRGVLAIVGLASRLAGARIRDPNIRERAICPEWLVEAMPHVWDTWQFPNAPPTESRDDRGLAQRWKVLWYNWLNPLLAANCRVGVHTSWLHGKGNLRLAQSMRHGPNIQIIGGRETTAD